MDFLVIINNKLVNLHMLLMLICDSFLNFVEVQEGILIEYAQSTSSPSGSSVMENYISRANGAVATDTSVQKFKSPKSSVSSLHSRAVDFVQTGELDIFEGKCLYFSVVFFFFFLLL